MEGNRILSRGVVALALLASAADADTKIPFPDLAKELRSRVGLEKVDPAAASLDQALRSGAYVGLDLGTFEIWYPLAELEGKGRAEELRELLLTIVDVYGVWVDYACQNQPGLAEARKDLALIGKWISACSPGALRKLDPEGSPSLYDLLGAKDEVKEAARRLRSFEEEGIKSRAWDGGWNLEGIHVTQVVLCPTRKCFLEHTAFAGEIDEAQRANLWSDEMVNRTSSWSGRTQMIALENAVWPVDIERPFQGATMNHFKKTGLKQHVVERVAMSLLRDIYYYLGTHFLEDALATNLVIAVCGHNMIGFSWAMEWRTQGATTRAYDRFVPGGNPSGGALPQRQAKPGPLQFAVSYISEWNRCEGQDYFRDPLKKAQKSGFERVGRDKDHPLHEDKNAHFELRNETGGNSVVTAPFLGPFAEGKTLPSHEFLDSYEEFFRAYRSAFFEWLRLHGGTDQQDSQRKFSSLIEGQATRDKDAPLHAVIESVYGLPLSAASGSPDNLEWRFLAWLSKSK